MKFGIVINTNEPETVWNAFRFGVKALEKGHSAAVFLLGKGVESENFLNSQFFRH